MKKFGFMLVGLLGLVAQPAAADLLGFANGRSANIDNMAGMSVEAGASLGDFQNFGGRVNYKVSPDLMVFGDLGMLDVDGFGGGMAFGAGAFYQLRNVQLLENTDFAVKGSYHASSVEFDACNGFGGCSDVDFSEITIEALISGDQLSTTDFGWYANAGMHILDVSVSGFGGDGGSNEIGFGGGITGSIAVGDWYAGVDFIDEMVFRAGFRYNLN